MTIKTFDRATCRIVDKKIEAALAKLADELGVSIRCKGGNFMATNYTIKLEVATKSEGGQVNTRAADDFRVMASLFGLSSDDLGRSFTAGKHTYKIVGLRPRATRRPVVAESDGKSYVFSAEDVKSFLSREKAGV